MNGESIRLINKLAELDACYASLLIDFDTREKEKHQEEHGLVDMTHEQEFYHAKLKKKMEDHDEF